MWFGHLHSTKEVPYGLFILHVQLDSTIGQIKIFLKNFKKVRDKTAVRKSYFIEGVFEDAYQTIFV